MMGDPGPSDLPVLPSFVENQRRHEFQRQVLPISGLQPSVPTSSTDPYPRPLPYFQRLDHHPSLSFRQDGYEEWTHPTSELASGPPSGHRAWVEDHMHCRSSDSGDTLDLLSRGRVGEADSSLPLSDALFTYPEGEDGAVTITGRDLEGLQPGRLLSDNIIDFYIKYLNLTLLSREDQKRFHFLSSFFFTKLLESTTPMGFDQCKVDYKQLRKWIGEVNLFEKDYVFIPIIDRSHWSLIVICHLNSLDPSSLGEQKGTPCILHLDPIEGKHECFEGQVQSLILQAWMERMRAIDNMDLLHVLVQMKYIQAKVPQQGNGYDCGLYILHYIEVFLSKSTSQDMTLSSFERGIFFTRPNFGMEVVDKRRCIQRLIFKLGGMLEVHDGSHFGLQSMPQQEVGLVHLQRHQQHKGLPKLVKEIKSKKWKEVETLILLQCMVEGGHFNKGKQGAMHWDLIAQEINVKSIGGPLRSKEQCQNRFDTLLKAYKNLNAYCLRMGKEFCNVTEDEKQALKLATPLGEEHEVWYNHLHTIYIQRSSLRCKSYKRQKFNLDGGIDVGKHVPSSLHSSVQSPPPLDVIGSSKSMDLSSIEVDVDEFNILERALKYTFLNLLQVWPLKRLLLISFWNNGDLSLEALCRMLAIVQDQNPLQIRNHVYQLRDLKLVTLLDMDMDLASIILRLEDCWVHKKWIGISNVEVYKKFGRKVLSKNPHLNTFHKLSCNAVIATKPCPLQQIRVLILNDCNELQNVDLGNFPDLRYLQIVNCAKLKVINGWEVAKGLGWIEIIECYSYCDFPDVQFLSSLKEFCFAHWGRPRISTQLADFSQCVQLRRLEIVHADDLVESMDLKALRFLEVLSFVSCTALSTIHGLSGLQTLIKLRVTWCKSLKTLPGLGCLKALTYLGLSSSGITEILGVEELHLLTFLDLGFCKSLGLLPPLGHLKALAHLDLKESGIEEIPGVEDLVSLETLYCNGSKLKRLPNLNHLCLLREINIRDTPLFRMDPRSFIGGYELIHNNRVEEGVFVDDISDISDLNDIEDISFDED